VRTDKGTGSELALFELALFELALGSIPPPFARVLERRQCMRLFTSLSTPVTPLGSFARASIGIIDNFLRQVQ
jgi:hypothetical protein